MTRQCPECGFGFSNATVCPDCGHKLVSPVYRLIMLGVMLLVGAAVVGLMILSNVAKP
jgi:hypothetical protein